MPRRIWYRLHAWIDPELRPFSFLGRSSYLLNYDYKISTQISVLKRKKAAQKRRRGYGEESKREERMDQRSTDLTASKMPLRITTGIDSDQRSRIFSIQNSTHRGQPGQGLLLAQRCQRGVDARTCRAAGQRGAQGLGDLPKLAPARFGKRLQRRID